MIKARWHKRKQFYGWKRLFSITASTSTFSLFAVSVFRALRFPLSLSLFPSDIFFQLCYSACITCEWEVPLDEKQRGPVSLEPSTCPVSHSPQLSDLIASADQQPLPSTARTHVPTYVSADNLVFFQKRELKKKKQNSNLQAAGDLARECVEGKRTGGRCQTMNLCLWMGNQFLTVKIICSGNAKSADGDWY